MGAKSLFRSNIIWEGTTELPASETNPPSLPTPFGYHHSRIHSRPVILQGTHYLSSSGCGVPDAFTLDGLHYPHVLLRDVPLRETSHNTTSTTSPIRESTYHPRKHGRQEY